MISIIGPDEIQKLLGKPTNAMQREIDIKVEWTLFVLRRCGFDSIPAIKLSYNLKGSTAGLAYRDGRIKLNIDLLYTDHYDDMLNNTLPHEIAHVAVDSKYTNADSHGKEWAYVMRLLGLEPTRCHEYDDIKPARQTKRFRVMCRNSHLSTVGLNRARKIARGQNTYYCAWCKTQVDLLDDFYDD